MHTLNVDAQTF